jgi:hypothetical protein
MDAHQIAVKRALHDEKSHFFHLPALLQVKGDLLMERIVAWQIHVTEAEEKLSQHQREIDDIAFSLYCIEEYDRKTIEETTNSQLSAVSEGGEEAHSLEDDEEAPRLGTDQLSLISDLISYTVGCVFGRWDLRYAANQRACPDLPDPFVPLPVCSSGRLTGDDGLPLHEAPPDYLLCIAPDGMLVDDPDRQDDIIRRIQGVLELIWENRADAIEQEACEILGVKELRDYFRKPGKGGFWDDHVKCYSKSRRKAPIYWLLQSSKKNYALWLYYHRLDKDILFKALVNYVEPKIRLEEGRLEPLRAQRAAAGSSGKGIKKLEKEIAQQEEFISELRDFEGKLRRVANLHLDPDLNDGVVLNIAPLRELVPWKEAQKYWDELLDGKYEWSSIGRRLRKLSLVRSP